MRVKTTFALCAIMASISAAFAAETITASLPPCVYTGRVTDYDGTGLHNWAAVGDAEVRVRKNGVLLARGNVVAYDADTTCNYSVAVPMATTSTPSAAAVGDTLTFEVDYPDSEATKYVSKNTVVGAGKSGTVVRMDLKLMNSTKVDGIDDKYVEWAEEYAAYLGSARAHGWNGSYDPNADYDGDGVSNREEYLAGTNPFDSGDAGLKITDIRMVAAADGTEMVELTFKPVYGYAYSVEHSTNSTLRADGFVIKSHRDAPDVSAAERKYAEGDATAEKKVYLVKEGALGLFRVRLD